MYAKGGYMKIEGANPGNEFRLTTKPSNMAQSTFTAITTDKAIVSRRLTDILSLHDDTPVIAHWHGQYRTEAFALTVKELKELAKAYKE